MKKADMTWPMRIWLSIVFAFLIVDNSFAVNGSTEGPFHQTADPDNYDVIDVANQRSNGDYNARAMTGQTTRYITNGEVDDDFWLKHLGEDYKNAIHLVVSNKNQYHDDYNMTGNEAHLLQEDGYASLKDNPVEYNDKQNTHKETQINSADNSYFENGSSTNSTDVTDNFNTTVAASSSSSSSNETKTLEPTNRTDSTNVNRGENVEQPYERVFAMGDTNMQFYNKFYNSNSFYKRNVDQKPEQTPQNLDTPNTYSQQTYTKHSQTYTKHSQTNIDTDTNTNTDKDNTNQEGRGTSEENGSSKSIETPVVVDLPEPQKNVYQLDGDATPMVLKMPPVIYHSNPTYMQHETNPQRHHTHLQRSKPMQCNTPHSPTYQTHYQPQQYSYYQSNYFRPHIEKSYAPLPYRKLGAFNSLPSKQTLNNANKAEGGQVLRYIISKASTAKQSSGEQMPKDEVPGLTRVSRSNQELFEVGL